ncbi:MAG: T9SS type A sorting domain-containing protein [Chitinophagaceae bacterium]
MKKIYMILGTVLLSAGVKAQSVSYTTVSSTYAENFDGLANSGATLISGSNGPTEILPATFTGSSVPGWYLSKYGGTGTNISLGVDNGASNSGAAFSYGSTGSSERGLGALASGTKIHRFGVVITNNTGLDLIQVTVNFTGEQWRLGQTPTNGDTLTFGYKVNATGINDIGFTPNTALDITSLFTTGTVGALDGNATVNKKAYTATITVAIPVGATLTLRWDDANDAGSDDGLAIDDFSFSAIDATLLPITLLSFDAIRSTTGNILNWKAENAQNFSHFEIERSANGGSFNTIGNVSTNFGSCSFTDGTPLAHNYYRLKMVDKDGKFSYSKVVAVINNAKGAVVTGIYPTITTGKLSMDISAEGTQKLQLLFLDLQGRIANSQTVTASTGNSTINLDASALAKGMYVVKVLQTNNEAASFKIVKQ